MYLDGDKASQKELDTVGVRLAIRKAKEEKEAQVEKTRLQIGEKLKYCCCSDMLRNWSDCRFLSGDESFADESLDVSTDSDGIIDSSLGAEG